MPDRRLEDLNGIVGANPQVPWGDFECTPVLEFDVQGKASDTARRCAITAGDRTVVLRLPQRVAIGAGAWPPNAVMEKMMEAVGPALPA